MTYYPDLTRYVYFNRIFENFDSANALNVGWLERGNPFRTGVVPPSFLDRLRRFCEVSFNQTRGFHLCDFCTEKYLSSAEIRVLGEDEKTYCAPKLVFHYVKAHNYLPPDEFVKAVMNGPFPGQAEYISFFTRRGIPFSPSPILRE